MICDNCIHNEVCDRLHFENHCGYKHTEADIINPELEKIKAEIKVNASGEYDFEGYCREEKISIKEVNKIIDNHIKELKG